MATVCEASLDSPYSKKDAAAAAAAAAGVSKRNGEDASASPPRSLTSPLRAKIESDNAFGGSPELPPIVRALAEDAKGMRARLKRYRDERDRGEKALVAQSSLCAKLRDKIVALESALAKFVNGGATRDAALRELRKAAASCARIDAAEERATDASKRATIERRSKEADSKKHRRAMLLLEREREDERREHEKTRAALFEKDREARAHALRIKTLAKKLKDANDAVAAATLQKDTLEGRRTTPGTAEDVVELELEVEVEAPSFDEPKEEAAAEAEEEEEEEDAPLAVEAVASPAAVPAPPPPIVVNVVIEPVERAHVMLCLIHDDAREAMRAKSPLAPPPPAAAEDEKERAAAPPPETEETNPPPPPPPPPPPTGASPSPPLSRRTSGNRPPPPPAAAGVAEIARWPEKQKPKQKPTKTRDAAPRSANSNSNADAARRSRSGGGCARPPVAAAGGRTSKA